MMLRRERQRIFCVLLSGLPPHIVLIRVSFVYGRGMILYFASVVSPWNLPPCRLATRIRARELRSSLSAGDGKERSQQWECLIGFWRGLSARVQWIRSRGTVSGAKHIARSGILPGYTPKIENPGFMVTAPSAMPRCLS